MRGVEISSSSKWGERGPGGAWEPSAEVWLSEKQINDLSRVLGSANASTLESYHSLRNDFEVEPLRTVESRWRSSPAQCSPDEEEMSTGLKGRSLLTLLDLKPAEIRHLLDVARWLKERRRRGEAGNLLAGKQLVLLFEKTSTRTRCSFEVAMSDEGGHVTFLDKESSQFGKKESIEDSAKVLGRYYHAIEYRGFEQVVVEALAKHSGVPVYNGLTDVDHPTQILADLMTIEEHVRKPLSEVKVVFVGDVRNNMCHAWMYGAAKMGMRFVALGPRALFPSAEAVRKVREICRETGGSLEVTEDRESLRGADVVYADVWVSMGEEAAMRERVALLSEYRVTMEMLRATANPEVRFMHCLPAYHDLETKVAREAWEEHRLDVREVTDEVFRSRHSVVFDEAENRMHTIKAVLVCTLTDVPDGQKP